MKITKTFNVQPNNWPSLIATLRDAYTALVSNLTFEDNIIGQFSTITLTTAANYTGGTFQPIVVPWNFAEKKTPQSVLVGQVIVPSSNFPLLSAVSTQWTYDSTKQVINILYIAGLNNSCQYTITLECK
jgi:hypothetical protein